MDIYYLHNFYQERGKMPQCSALVIKHMRTNADCGEAPTAQRSEWLTLQGPITPRAGGDGEQLELARIADGITKWCGHFAKTVGQFLTKPNIH